jgi:hypothetical protein
MQDYIHIDTRNPLHAEAYLIAAGHFLSKWPQDWNAERLALALLADEYSVDNQQEDQKQIKAWEAISKFELNPMDDASPFAFVEELINNLAEDFVGFHTKHSKQ